MRLKVLIPSGVLLDEEAQKVNAEGRDGAFCLLPRHVDFVSALAPGLLAFTGPDGERFVAHDEAVLVKCGAEVLVATRQASFGGDLEKMEQAIAERFAGLDEQEREVRSSLARLEAGFTRRFLDLGRGP